MGFNPPPGQTYKTTAVIANKDVAFLMGEGIYLQAWNSNGYFEEGKQYVVNVTPSADGAGDSGSGSGEQGNS